MDEEQEQEQKRQEKRIKEEERRIDKAEREKINERLAALEKTVSEMRKKLAHYL